MSNNFSQEIGKEEEVVEGLSMLGRCENIWINEDDNRFQSLWERIMSKASKSDIMAEVCYDNTTRMKK